MRWFNKKSDWAIEYDRQRKLARAEEIRIQNEIWDIINNAFKTNNIIPQYRHIHVSIFNIDGNENYIRYEDTKINLTSYLNSDDKEGIILRLIGFDEIKKQNDYILTGIKDQE